MFNRTVHPGIILAEELEHLGVTLDQLANQIQMPERSIRRLATGKQSVDGITALRLGHWFQTDPMFWLNLQSAFDLASARKRLGDKLERLPRRQMANPIDI